MLRDIGLLLFYGTSVIGLAYVGFALWRAWEWHREQTRLRAGE